MEGIDGPWEVPMEAELSPSAIVTQMLELAGTLERWADSHRTANLAEHEQGVLSMFRQVLGLVLGAVLERAQGLDQPTARRVRAACPGCGARRRAHQWRTRQPLSVCGPTPYERPTFWCAACQRSWVSADVVLELAPHQVLSAGLQAWVAETGAELPFRQAAERLERLTSIGLGVETVRTHTQQVGTALVERQQRAAAIVLQTQEPAEVVDAAPEVLVIEADGRRVLRFRAYRDRRLLACDRTPLEPRAGAAQRRT
jgi:hypothetical protein